MWWNNEPAVCHALSSVLLTCHLLVPLLFPEVLNLGVLNLENPMVSNLYFFSWTTELLCFTLLTTALLSVSFLPLSHTNLGHIVFDTFPTLLTNKPEQRSQSWAVLSWVLPHRQRSPWGTLPAVGVRSWHRTGAGQKWNTRVHVLWASGPLRRFFCCWCWHGVCHYVPSTYSILGRRRMKRLELFALPKMGISGIHGMALWHFLLDFVFLS